MDQWERYFGWKFHGKIAIAPESNLIGKVQCVLDGFSSVDWCLHQSRSDLLSESLALVIKAEIFIESSREETRGATRHIRDTPTGGHPWKGLHHNVLYLGKEVNLILLNCFLIIPCTLVASLIDFTHSHSTDKDTLTFSSPQTPPPQKFPDALYFTTRTAALPETLPGLLSDHLCGHNKKAHRRQRTEPTQRTGCRNWKQF